MTEKIFAVDVDSTLADTMPLWVDEYNRKFDGTKPKVSVQDIKKWKLSEIFAIDERTVTILFGKAWKRWKEVKPVDEYAIPVLQEFKKVHKEWKIHIITAQTKLTIHNVLRWIYKNRIPFDYFSYLPARKGTHYKELMPFHVIIDDNLETVSRIHKTIVRKALLYSRPWNEMPDNDFTYYGLRDIPRIRKWNEVLFHPLFEEVDRLHVK